MTVMATYLVSCKRRVVVEKLCLTSGMIVVFFSLLDSSKKVLKYSYTGGEAFTLMATSVSGLESDPSDVIQVIGGQSSTCEDTSEDLLNDVPNLMQRACDSSTNDVTAKHLVYLLKGRLWNNETNRKRLQEIDAVKLLVSTMKRFTDDVDTVIKILAILEDLFSFNGVVKLTCAATHGIIPEGTCYIQTSRNEIIKNWLPSGFICASSSKPIFSDVTISSVLNYSIHNDMPYSNNNAPASSQSASAKPILNCTAAPDPSACLVFIKSMLKSSSEFVTEINKLCLLYPGDDYLMEKIAAVVRHVIKQDSEFKKKIPNSVSNFID